MVEQFGIDTLTFTLAVAYLLGIAARAVRMPPMVGFLVTGFVLNALGVPPAEGLERIADMGVLLLLFTIGLKLNPMALVKAPILGSGSIHMASWCVIVSLLIWAGGMLGFRQFTGLGWQEIATISFALSFSSTVFAVKVFDEKGELGSVHGRMAIGILIFQDVVAAVFLTVVGGKIPSVWAFGLVGLLLLRPILFRMLDRLGHGEMLPLFGFFTLMVLGVASFQVVGLKPDLGALVVGMLLADHRRAGEVADSLFGFKEVFLIGFFLQIGLDGLPSLAEVMTALVLVGLLLLKGALFFFLLVAFRLRARTAFLGALGLATYSEFGLIVGAVAVHDGLLGQEWLLVFALTVAVSFAVLSPLNTFGHDLYARFTRVLRRFEHRKVDLADVPLRTGEASILIFGMGRLGQAIYDRMREKHGDNLVGIETNTERVASLTAAGWNVVHGDATDSDFWLRASRSGARTRAILLAMPEHKANVYALEQIRAQGFTGYIAAIARYPDEVPLLEEAGATFALDLFGEAGSGFADDVDERLGNIGL
ncbi:cation:proton antiporter [Rhodobacteraceae bacterium NNCM2]|nr:cation:proton antiporter [Coraliihabitans acroporae]